MVLRIFILILAVVIFFTFKYIRHTKENMELGAAGESEMEKRKTISNTLEKFILSEDNDPKLVAVSEFFLSKSKGVASKTVKTLEDILVSKGIDPKTARAQALKTWLKWGNGNQWDFPSECKYASTKKCTCGHHYETSVSEYSDL